MRTLSKIVLGLCLILGLDAFGQPDFAFPKTVAKDAREALLKAENNNDPAGALNALMQLFVAECNIDPASPHSDIIQLTGELGQHFSQTDLAGIFPLLQAKMYAVYILENGYGTINRDTPLLPLPEDITEWSAKQLAYVTDSLCQKSVCPDMAQRLMKLRIQDFKDIVEIPTDYTSEFFPTMLDFAYSQMVSIFRDIETFTDIDLDKHVTLVADLALSRCKRDSAPWVYWSVNKICNEGYCTHEDFLPLKAFIDSNIDCRYIGYALSLSTFTVCQSPETILAIYDPDDPEENYSYDSAEMERMSRKSWFVETAQHFKVKYPNSPFLPEIDEKMDEILKKNLILYYPEFCYPGDDLTVAAINSNIDDYTVYLYEYKGTEKDLNVKQAREYAETHKPVAQQQVRHEFKLPFELRDTIKLNVPRAGRYIVYAKYDGMEDYKMKKGNNRYYPNSRLVDCRVFFPVVADGVNDCSIFVVDPKSGLPIKDVDVKIPDGSNTTRATTDSAGVALLQRHGQYRLPLVLSANGLSSTYYGLVPLYKNNRVSTDPRYSASVLTDRGLYHPGDSIYFLAVASVYFPDADRQALLNSTGIKVNLRNTNNQVVESFSGTTDDFGRLSGAFFAPTEGLTGSYTITVEYKDEWICGKRVTVSDYKVPDFLIETNPAACDVPTPGAVTISGRAVTYAGMPLAGVNISANVLGFQRWYSTKNIFFGAAVTGDDGSFSIEIDSAYFNRGHNYFWRYMAEISGVSQSGTTASAYVNFSVGKRYIIALDADNNIDALLPFKPKVQVLDHEGKDVAIPLKWEITKNKTIVANGTLSDTPINISHITPGRYTFTVYPDDTTIADKESISIAIFNTNTDIVPGSGYLWVYDESLQTNANGETEILYGTTDEETFIYILTGYGDGYLTLDTSRDNKGYHRYHVALPDSVDKAEIRMVYVKNWNMNYSTIQINRPEETGLDFTCETFRDKLDPGATETWKFTVKSRNGATTQSALVLDMYDKALDALSPHSLNLYFPNYKRFITPNINSSYNSTVSAAFPSRENDILRLHSEFFMPDFLYINGLGYNFMAWRYMGYQTKDLYGALAGGANRQYSVAYAEDCVEDCEAMDYGVDLKYDTTMVKQSSEVEYEMDEEATESADFDFREIEVPLAIWAPALTTDNEGNVSFTFTLPNALTTWKLLAMTWNKALEKAYLSRELVVSKPVMVQANLPRFLRAADIAYIQAAVMNNTDTDARINTVVEVFDPTNNSVLLTEKFNLELKGMSSKVVSIKVDAPTDASAIGYRVRAVREIEDPATAGKKIFSDGEQGIIPILNNEAALIETTPFYLNPGETKYTHKLPKGNNMRLTLSFSENPVWTIVSALPGLRKQICEYSSSAAAGIYSALVARGIITSYPNVADALQQWKNNPNDSELVSMLNKNEDLKQAMLNCTPWIQAAQNDTERMAALSLIFDTDEIRATVEEGKKILSKLQRNDGGWAWSTWCDESSVWTTENVLSMFYDLKCYGWWPSDESLNSMARKGVAYLDRKVEGSDLTYTIIRPIFNDVSIPANGKKIINNTLEEIRKNWKVYSSPSYKAMAAMAAWINGQKDLAREIMRSVSEFGVFTKDQGLTFPSVNALSSYALILRAFAMIAPDCQEVDGLRQQLIVRKQATDWGTAVVTTEVVNALLSTGTTWTVASSGADITVGDMIIAPENDIDKYTGTLRADLSDYAGQKLTITHKAAGPAYGAVYAQFDKKMSDVKAVGVDDLTIEKQMFVVNGETVGVISPGSLRVGDRIKVQLTVHCKRNMQYVTIIDERPAAFEPADQLPGWTYCDGARFYRENRDSFTGLYITNLLPGTYLLTYEMKVNTAGIYSSGVATIQSQYAPELTAHSSGSVIQINP